MKEKCILLSNLFWGKKKEGLAILMASPLVLGDAGLL